MKTEQILAVQMSAVVKQTMQDMNSIETNGKVRSIFQACVVELREQIFGLEALIIKILTDNGAIFPLNAENTSLCNIVIASSMTSGQIKTSVNQYFTAGTSKYPLTSIQHYLKNVMAGKVRQVCQDDYFKPMTVKTKKMGRPMVKWYLIQTSK